MARKLLEHIAKNDVSVDSEEDAHQLVSLVTNQRRPNPVTTPSAASSNPFGGLPRRPEGGGGAGVPPSQRGAGR